MLRFVREKIEHMMASIIMPFYKSMVTLYVGMPCAVLVAPSQKRHGRVELENVICGTHFHKNMIIVTGIDFAILFNSKIQAKLIRKKGN